MNKVLQEDENFLAGLFVCKIKGKRRQTRKFIIDKMREM